MLSPGTFALTALLALLTALGPLAMDLYLPSLPAIEAALAASAAQVQLTISVYLIGFAIGQLIYGPISDRFGRKPVLIAGTLTGAKIVTRHGFNRSLGVGAAALAGGGLLLIAAVGLAPSRIAVLALPMMIFLAGVGLVLPLSMAAALHPFPERAGAASSFMGSVQQVVGAAVGVIIGHALGASAWPMVIGIAVSGCTTLLLWLATRDVRTRPLKPHT